MADFGREFMDAVALWLRDHERLTFPGDAVAAAPQPVRITASAIGSLQLYREGLDIPGIMARSGLARSTVCKHLADAILCGKLEVSPRKFYTEAEEQAISAAAETVGLDALGPLFQALEGRIPYETLHFYRAFALRESVV